MILHITEYHDRRGPDLVEPPLKVDQVDFTMPAQSSAFRPGTLVVRFRLTGADGMVSIGPKRGMEWFAAADQEYTRHVPGGGDWRIFIRAAE